MMKKTVLAMVLAATMVSGCSMIGGGSTMTPAELNAEYTAVASEEVTLSKIDALSIVAVSTNELFVESQPIYADYVAHVAAASGNGAAHSAAIAMLETEEEQAAYISDLKAADEANNTSEFADYEAFINDEKMKSIYARVASSAMKIGTQSVLIAKLDTSSLISNSDLDFSAMASEKDVVSLMADQMSVLDKTIGALYNEYQANKAANLIK